MAEGGNNSPIFRNKRGQFISKRKKQWLENVANSNAQRKKKNDKNNEKTCIVDGSKVVELDTLAKELWCKKCNISLSLCDIVAETKHGLASEFDVACRKCKNICKVNTCKKSPGVRNQYGINKNIISGIQEAGINLDSFNMFLSASEVPTIEPSLIEECKE